MLIAFAITLVASTLLSAVLTLAARAWGRRLLLMDSQGVAGHVKEQRRVPNIGGVAIYWSFVLSVLAGLGAVWLLPDLLARSMPAAEVHLAGARTQTGMALGLLGCALVLHVLGLIDDRRALGPWLKFAVQTIVALVAAWALDVRLLTLLDVPAGGPWLSIALTTLWLVVVTNAMNFMDNMDGLAGGVGATAGAALLVAAMVAGQWFVGAALAVLIGSLLGFLVLNFPWTERRRASIFMGDGGSLVLGFLLAVLAVRVTYVPSGAPGDVPSGTGQLAMLMPLCVLAVPLYDLVSVSVIRLSQGRSPLVGDRQHFSHRLAASGLSVRRTVLVICGCVGITGIGGVLLSTTTTWQAGLIFVQVLVVLGVIGMYEHGKGWPHRAGPGGAGGTGGAGP